MFSNTQEEERNLVDDPNDEMGLTVDDSNASRVQLSSDRLEKYPRSNRRRSVSTVLYNFDLSHQSGDRISLAHDDSSLSLAQKHDKTRSIPDSVEVERISSEISSEVELNYSHSLVDERVGISFPSQESPRSLFEPSNANVHSQPNDISGVPFVILFEISPILLSFRVLRFS